MQPDDDSAPVVRRISMRRSRGNGFSGGVSTRSESLRAAEEDEVDDAVQPERIHERIIREAQRRAPPAAALPPPSADIPDDPTGEAPGAPSPRERMHQVAMEGGANYAREYRLRLLHRLLMRQVPEDQIARQLGVSISTVQKDRVLLKSKLRETARSMDINEIIGHQSGVYDELSGMALLVATNNQTPTAMRLAAMRTTLAAEADRTRFLNTAGVFDVLRYRRSEDSNDISDIQMLMNRTDEMLAQLMSGDAPAPTAPAPRRRRGTMNPMTFDDAGASSGDAEVAEI